MGNKVKINNTEYGGYSKRSTVQNIFHSPFFSFHFLLRLFINSFDKISVLMLIYITSTYIQLDFIL